ncbi:AAA family ATPase [Acidithiobacillus ferrooxidans]|uniref:AAA family ATPase n=1 Tax=Acidithiobacillus ferrooxidans TaxID=920 RepID=UPI000A78BD84|nr:AAA family ATPase [Acidithiobacillus ferrooxidans]
MTAKHQPVLILVGGFPGTGKTTIGQKLAKTLGVGWVDKDSATRLMAEHLLLAMGCGKNDRESATYTRYVKPLEYDTLISIARDNLNIGQSVICTAPFISQFHDQEWIDRMQQLVDLYAAKLSLIWLTADTEVTHSRIVQRNADRDAWKIGCWPEYMVGLPEKTPSDHRIWSVDNTSCNGVDVVVMAIIRLLGSPTLKEETE